MSKTDYYSEEKTISAPLARPTGAGFKLYGKDIRDLDDGDLEGLLSKLSPEELEDLNSDFDPDNSLLPPSQRCRNQTTKEPTGPFQREKLLKYLEETAKKEEDWEENVPYCAGLKRGKVYEPKPGELSPTRISGGMEMPIELDVDDDDDEDDDIREALSDAPEKDLVDLAGILGMHNLLNQPQYYNALKGSGQDESTGTTFRGVIKAFEPKMMPEEPDNKTDIDECIRQLDANDENLKEININNMKGTSKERIRKLIKAACSSKHINKLLMANTGITDQEARGLVELIETSPSLRTLNIETNFVSPEMLARILRATLVTQNLVEFHAENQRACILGNQIEMDIMLTVEENESLLRVGVALQSMEARHRVSEALERNYERLRLKRLEKAPAN